MENSRKIKADITKFYNKTVKNMKELGTFKKEFDAPVRRYAELQVQYGILINKWYESDCAITELYTNKSGAKNQRKTPLYLSIESLRKELIDMENVFGLTPKGLKTIKSKALETQKVSALDKLFNDE